VGGSWSGGGWTAATAAVALPRRMFYWNGLEEEDGFDLDARDHLFQTPILNLVSSPFLFLSRLGLESHDAVLPRLLQ